jgi:hypothetical protein
MMAKYTVEATCSFGISISGAVIDGKKSATVFNDSVKEKINRILEGVQISIYGLEKEYSVDNVDFDCVEIDTIDYVKKEE